MNSSKGLIGNFDNGAIHDRECPELVGRLKKSVAQNRTDAILLSGGLDSTILSSLLKPELAVTVVISDNAPDLAFSKSAAKKFCTNHRISVVFQDALPSLVDSVIRALKTFDPMEIRNSLVVLAGIRAAKLEGYSALMTGDGADELFAGYNYLARYFADQARLQFELERLWSVMHFSSMALGEVEGVIISAPYLDRDFVEFSKSVHVSRKVSMHNGAYVGKFVLRKCFEGSVGTELAWRRKMAQEEGSGMSGIKPILESTVSDAEFADGVKSAALHRVNLRSKEHLFYFKRYLKYFQPPELEYKSENPEGGHCPECRAPLGSGRRFCRTCGAFPVTAVK